MDLDHLYHRRGVSPLMAQRAACGGSRRAHRAFRGAYAITHVIREAWRRQA